VSGSASSEAAGRVWIRPDAARELGAALLLAHGVPAADATVVADCLVRADLRGVDTHGLALLPGYLARIRQGLLEPAPQLVPERVATVAARLDGQNGLGFVIATVAMREAIDIASEHGVGVVAAYRSSHFGMAANYVLQASDAGFVAIGMTNASPALPPHGGRTALFGTSPIAFGVPDGHEGIVLDMSPAIAARGKIRRAARRGEPIPEGIALDADGLPTTDADAALGGVVLPLGGPKGAGLALMMDVFAGVLTGAEFAGDVADRFGEDRPQGTGHLFLALRKDLFVSVSEFERRMGVLTERVHAVLPAEGVDQVLLPGERGHREATRRQRTGLAYGAAEGDALLAEARAAGITPPQFSDGPFEEPPASRG
jgi:LDH2 family malate/lactate/ureidoglycolate dehydrogenase